MISLSVHPSQILCSISISVFSICRRVFLLLIAIGALLKLDRHNHLWPYRIKMNMLQYAAIKQETISCLSRTVTMIIMKKIATSEVEHVL